MCVAYISIFLYLFFLISEEKQNVENQTIREKVWANSRLTVIQSNRSTSTHRSQSGTKSSARKTFNTSPGTRHPTAKPLLWQKFLKLRIVFAVACTNYCPENITLIVGEQKNTQKSIKNLQTTQSSAIGQIMLELVPVNFNPPHLITFKQKTTFELNKICLIK